MPAIQRRPGPTTVQTGGSLRPLRLLLRNPGEDQGGPQPTCVRAVELRGRAQRHSHVSGRCYRQYPERPTGEGPLQHTQAEFFTAGLGQGVPQLHRARLHG